ncbi:MAG: hypothetical protein EXR75_15085, partial [Myxococcales bacterium]|nr:hypothetical protein [Myxococcales bacterium]
MRLSRRSLGMLGSGLALTLLESIAFAAVVDPRSEGTAAKRRRLVEAARPKQPTAKPNSNPTATATATEKRNANPAATATATEKRNANPAATT